MDEVIVVGGGPAGAFAALLLARAGWRVRLFDRARFPRPKLCGDTLNPGASATLARHLDLGGLLTRARPLAGMLLTGPGGVAVRATYGPGVHGFSIERRVFDHWLLEHAITSGVRVEEDCTVEAVTTSNAMVTGVRVRSRAGSLSERARLVIAADGRHSRLAFGLGLTRHPRRPRRWAIGAYFTGVDGLADVGEMHVRREHYIGVAPLHAGAANACLVVPHERGGRGWREAAGLLTSRLAADARLGPRFAQARMIGAPAVLGPMAVDAVNVGTAGLLLAGDAAGFIDPMTGDGLTFAVRSAELAAAVADEVLTGTLDAHRAAAVLQQRRHAAFGKKCRFNRALRQLVASPLGVSGAAVTARLAPQVFQQMIRYAGDVGRG